MSLHDGAVQNDQKRPRGISAVSYTMLFHCITRNVRRNLLYLLHLLSMTVKQVTQPLTHILIGLLSQSINHFMELHFLIFE